MKAYKLSKYGLKHLKLTQMNDPIIGRDQVLVKQCATSINSADLDLIKGSLLGRVYGLFRPRYKIPGSDLAGVILELGQNVTAFEVGDRVFGDMSEEKFATYSTHKVVKASTLTKIPDGMSFATAASLPSAGVLALQAIEKFPLNERSKVCINGVGGGMGSLCLQLAKHYGAYVVGIDSSYKEAQSLAYGVDEYFDYRKFDYTTLDYKFDLIIDCQCLVDVRKFEPMLNVGGVYTMIGGSVKRIIQVLLLGKKLTKRNNKEIGILFGEMNDLSRMKKLCDLCSEQKLKPVIEKIYNFDELPMALEHFQSGKFVGKIVVKIEHDR